MYTTPVPTVNDTAGSGASSGKGKLQLKRRKRKMAKKVAEQVIADRLGEEIYKNKYGYKVYAVILREKDSMRVSIEVYIVNPQNKMSEMINFKRQDIMNKESVVDVLYDYEGDFDSEDIEIILDKLRAMLTVKAFHDVQNKATQEELHIMFSQYIRNIERENAEKVETVGNEEENKEDDYSVFIKDGYGYMKTTLLEKFISNTKEITGYSKRLDILKLLKVMGVLKNAKNRPYDMLVSIGGEKVHYYKVALAEEQEEVEDEVIEL